MNLTKRLYMEESEKLYAEAEEAGNTVSDIDHDKIVSQRANDRFAAMCDEAKDRAKYE